MKTVPTAQPKLYIGIDIHKLSWKVHCATDLFCGKSFSMPPKGWITFIDRDRFIITYNHTDAGGHALRWTKYRMRSKLFKGRLNTDNPIGIINISTPHHHHYEVIKK